MNTFHMARALLTETVLFMQGVSFTKICVVFANDRITILVNIRPIHMWGMAAYVFHQFVRVGPTLVRHMRWSAKVCQYI
jgi:hypothetical protein